MFLNRLAIKDRAKLEPVACAADGVYVADDSPPPVIEAYGFWKVLATGPRVDPLMFALVQVQAREQVEEVPCHTLHTIVREVGPVQLEVSCYDELHGQG